MLALVSAMVIKDIAGDYTIFSHRIPPEEVLGSHYRSISQEDNMISTYIYIF